jgi:FkbM family methyltransferase
MRKTIEKYLWKLLRKADPAYHSAKVSWSQQGEDMIIDFIFTWQLECPMPSYLEIGANHPSNLNNSYFFYKKGCRGVNIEPDSSLFKLLKKSRPLDINLCIGIGAEDMEMDFYKMSMPTLNTFSKVTAETYTADRQFGYPTITAIEKVRILPVNEILNKYFNAAENYFISIDIEGWDFEVLSAIDFSTYRPAVICIETNKLIGKDVEKYINLLDTAGYLLYADTSINSIFLDKKRISNSL